MALFPTASHRDPKLRDDPRGCQLQEESKAQIFFKLKARSRRGGRKWIEFWGIRDECSCVLRSGTLVWVDPVVKDEIERSWSEVLGAWEDDQAHLRFLVLADARGALAEAGLRYRSVAERDPGRRAVADRRIAEILARALARMEVRREPIAKSGGRRLEWAGLGLSIALMAAALWQLVR